MQRRHYTSLAFWAIARHEALRTLEVGGTADESVQPLGQEPTFTLVTEQSVEMAPAADIERAA